MYVSPTRKIQIFVLFYFNKCFHRIGNGSDWFPVDMFGRELLGALRSKVCAFVSQTLLRCLIYQQRVLEYRLKYTLVHHGFISYDPVFNFLISQWAFCFFPFTMSYLPGQTWPRKCSTVLKTHHQGNEFIKTN
jgi:hypothetical protein